MKAIYALVGMKHRGTESVVQVLRDGQPLLLVREPTNQYDKNAVQVWLETGGEMVMLGYVSAKQNVGLVRKLDAPSWHQTSRHTGQRCINGVLRQRTGDRWPMVEVEE